MPLYESTFVARQDISTQEVENLTQRFSQIVVDNGGKVVKSEYWGLRTLAYAIKKNRKGHYVMLCLDSLPAAVKELERNLRLHDDILRTVTVRVEEIEKGPSYMISGKGDQDEGRDGYRNQRGASRVSETSDSDSDAAVA